MPTVWMPTMRIYICSLRLAKKVGPLNEGMDGLSHYPVPPNPFRTRSQYKLIMCNKEVEVVLRQRKKEARMKGQNAQHRMHSDECRKRKQPNHADPEPTA